LREHSARVYLFAASGSDAAALQTTAKLDGDNYILNGTKVMCKLIRYK